MIQDLQTQLQMLLSRHTYFQRINRQLRPRLLGEVEDIQGIYPPTRVECQEPRSFWKHQKYSSGGDKMISTCLKSATWQHPESSESKSVDEHPHCKIAIQTHPGSLVGIPSLVELHGSIVQQRMKHGRLVAAVVFLSWGHGRSTKH